MCQPRQGLGSWLGAQSALQLWDTWAEGRFRQLEDSSLEEAGVLNTQETPEMPKGVGYLKRQEYVLERTRESLLWALEIEKGDIV